ncbi:hypothetical protein ABZY57_17855 [Streptomyces sp. NPDC006450]|uniref:hypothetical protein n=1 Tax=Streptomyces sp. NPDC006450 TaxID=3155458 RepID=UPI0033B94491
MPEPVSEPVPEPEPELVLVAEHELVPAPVSEPVAEVVPEPVLGPESVGAVVGAVWGPPGAAAVRDALGDWRQDAVLICLLPVLCWPAVIGAVVTRPTPLRVVLLGLLCLPVLVALRELYVARRVRALLGAPGLRWTAYEAEVVRGRGLPPLLVLGGGLHVLTLGPLGGRVLAPRAGPRSDPALAQSALPPSPAESDAPDPSAERFVWLAGEPGPGAVVWAPRARELGRARGPWRRGALSRRRPPR